MTTDESITIRTATDDDWDAVALLEETLPAHVLLSIDDVEAATHPRGSSFFTGDPRHMSDDDARRIAAEQLARTGYARTGS